MFVSPVNPVKERLKEDVQVPLSKNGDAKVKGVFLQLISEAADKALFPSAFPNLQALVIALDFVSSFSPLQPQSRRWKKRLRTRKGVMGKRILVGFDGQRLKGE